MALSDDHEDTYFFGPFRMDLSLRALARDGVLLNPTPTVLEVLTYFVRNPGRVVSRSELLGAIWPGRIVEAANVKQAVFTLRKLLGDEGDRIIQTVPGFGYRFTEDVRRSVARHSAELAPKRAAGRAFSRPAVWFYLLTIILLVVGIAAALRWRTAHAGASGRTVALADFDNRTGDPIFDRTLANLLRSDLSQSPYLNVISEKLAQQTLSLMTRPTDTPVTPALAEEICTRNNGDAVVQGDISSLGTRYIIVLSATDCSGTHMIAAEKDEVVTREAVAPAVDSLIARIRSRLGESAGSIDRFNVPLLSARTPSLDALKAYSEAKWLFDHGRRADAIPLDLHAVELDPGFTAAYANLGVIYIALYDQEKASAALSKAFVLRSTMNERTQLQITALYDQFVTKDYADAIRNFQLWTEVYPQDAVAWSNLANAEDYIGRHDQAIADGRRAIALKPNLENPYAVLARAELEAGQADAGKAVADIAVAQGIAADSTHRELLRIADLQQDANGLRREQAWASSAAAPLRTEEAEAEIALSRGQIGAALEAFDAISRGNTDRGTYDFVRPVEARLLAELGLKQKAASLIADVDLKAGPDPDYLLATAAVGDTALARRLIDQWRRRTPSDTLLNAVFAPQAEAFLALRRGDAKAAVTALQPALSYQSRGLDVPYQLGMTALAAGNGKLAASAFETVLQHRGWAPESPLYPLAMLGVARAQRLDGDLAASLASYRSFLTAWKRADPTTPILRAAQSELRTLETVVGRSRA